MTKNTKIVAGREMAITQYCDFHNTMLEKSASDIYENAFKITVMEAFKQCIEDLPNNSVINRLLCMFADKKVSMDKLYSQFLSYDDLSVGSHQDTLMFFAEALRNIVAESDL